MTSLTREFWIGLCSTLPDDTVWEDSGELQLPGGRNILEVIVTHLKSIDYECSSVSQYSHFGWEAYVEKNSAELRLLIQFVESYWVIVACGKGGLFNSRKAKISVVNLADDLKQWMVSVPFFTNVVFGSRSDLISAGYRIKER